MSKNLHQEASSTIALATKLTTTSNSNQNDINCVNRAKESKKNESSIYSDSVNLSSVADDSVTLLTQIKKKSSFLHRDYNRKPILARSQVSNDQKLGTLVIRMNYNFVLNSLIDFFSSF